MSSANPTWGSPRILGELRKLGIDVAKSTVERYMVLRPGPTSSTWMSFLKNHARDLVSIDFFIVPTVRFRILFVLVVLATHRQRLVHFNITENPSAQQIVEAFPWGEAPRYLLRDRDSIYGAAFSTRVRNVGIQEVRISPRSPWQNPYVERFIGSIRRELLNHVIVLSEHHLRRLIRDYLRYCHGWRTHLALEMDTPVPRPIQPCDLGDVVEIPEVAGLHHHYERRAA